MRKRNQDDMSAEEGKHSIEREMGSRHRGKAKSLKQQLEVRWEKEGYLRERGVINWKFVAFQESSA